MRQINILLLAILFISCHKSKEPKPLFKADFESDYPEFFYYNCKRENGMVKADSGKPVTILTKKPVEVSGLVKWSIKHTGQGYMTISLLAVSHTVTLADFVVTGISHSGTVNVPSGNYVIRVTYTEIKGDAGFDDLILWK